jgi:ferric-dicitrate binding protein FerR (iron transport regulator)
MTWNYRVVVKDGQFAVYEVFYDSAGRIQAFTEGPVFPRADSLEELVEEFERYRRALILQR